MPNIGLAGGLVGFEAVETAAEGFVGFEAGTGRA